MNSAEKLQNQIQEAVSRAKLWSICACSGQVEMTCIGEALDSPVVDDLSTSGCDLVIFMNRIERASTLEVPH